MTTLLFFLILSAFFLFYQTSKRAELNRSFLIEKLAQSHPGRSKIIGLVLLLVSLIGCMSYWGISSGIFAFLIVLTTVGSLVILLAPLRYMSYQLVTSFLVISFIVELIFT